MLNTKNPHLYDALFTVFSLVIIMGVSLIKFKIDPHIPLLFGSVVASLIALKAGFKWVEIEKGMIKGITQALHAIIILLVIGVLVGIWIQAGVVPSMIYYGLSILSPRFFLPTTLIICSLTALALGSWGTAATVGMALMGIASGLKIPAPIAAGAIISGSYFGEKISPISDVTNLAAAMAETNLFAHIKHTLYTVLPTYIISILLYSFLGLRLAQRSSFVSEIDDIKIGLTSQFSISPILLIPPLIIIICILLKIPAIPSIISGVITAVGEAMIFQKINLGVIMNAGFSGYLSNSGNKVIDNLLSAGGMTSMMYSVSLTFLAMMFGGIMEETGQMQVLIKPLIRRLKRDGQLICATIISCIIINMLLPDQYMSIVFSGRMYLEEYKERGLHLENLSRSLGDAGALTSVLIPWNTCGAFMKSVLGISAAAYGPWAFFNYINPLVAFIYGITGFTIVEKKASKKV